jgi:hypothetical protein
LIFFTAHGNSLLEGRCNTPIEAAATAALLVTDPVQSAC